MFKLGKFCFLMFCFLKYFFQVLGILGLLFQQQVERLVFFLSCFVVVFFSVWIFFCFWLCLVFGVWCCFCVLLVLRWGGCLDFGCLVCCFGFCCVLQVVLGFWFGEGCLVFGFQVQWVCVEIVLFFVFCWGFLYVGI